MESNQIENQNESENNSNNNNGIVESVNIEKVSESIHESLKDNQNHQDCSTTSKLSKRKQRRLKREQKWAETRAERRRAEKKRRRERRQQDRKNGIIVDKPRIQIVSMANSSCKTKIIIDCDYESYMNDNELRKLCKQLMFCYAINRRSPAPAQLWITSLRGKLYDLMERYHYSYHNWDCNISDKHWTEILGSSDIDYKSNKKLIYLTGDATETIPDCNEILTANDYTFIIGGLIDHNRHKCLCLNRARDEFKMNYGQLPIEMNIKMNQRRILSIPHVYEIMLLASNGKIDTFSWSQIFQKVIPQRKID